MGILYYGDNLEILRNKIQDETIDLCYIDPPFNSKRSYFQIYNDIGGEQDKAQAQAFVDTWKWDTHAIEGHQQIISNFEGRFTRQSIELIKGLEIILGKNDLLAYLVSMTLCINEIYRVLKPTGSFYLHCDPTASHYLKLVLDAVFCGQGGDYVNEIAWCYSIGGRISKRAYGRRHDVLLFYVKGDNHTFNWDKILDEWSETGKAKFRYEDENGRYRLMGRFIKDSPIKGHRDVNPEWEKTHPELVYRHYLKEGKMQVDWWNIPPINQASKERLGYPTQKPEALLERVIEASSSEGDTVLDAYCGCGTTIAVAERLKRNWIGIDITYHSISLILKRMESFGENVMKSIKVDGIPQDIEAAKALATRQDDRVRKEFEKWAVLTYTNNRAVINTKKGADKGIDGVVYFATGVDTSERMVIQVKSGGVSRSVIATLHGDMERENAKMATLITLEDPTKPMKEEASKTGLYFNPLMGKNYDKIQIVTVQELIEQEKRLELPLSHEVLKTAVKQSGSNSQLKIGF
jgi:site-specific DNA-methyltransferase (adenine-specific)